MKETDTKYSLYIQVMEHKKGTQAELTVTIEAQLIIKIKVEMIS